MGRSVLEPREGELLLALAFLEKALQILDAVDAPGIVGAQVDLAMCNLRDLLENVRQMPKQMSSTHAYRTDL